MLLPIFDGYNILSVEASTGSTAHLVEHPTLGLTVTELQDFTSSSATLEDSVKDTDINITGQCDSP